MRIPTSSTLVLASLLIPFVASAHEHAHYKIGDGYYQIVIGSLNEPVSVDDKSGLDLSVTKCFNASCKAKMSADGDMDGPAGTPVSGLEKTLKVELSAGESKKTLSITPQWGRPGAYATPIYFTVPSTFSYRLIGEINNTPVDLKFTCVPAGSPKAVESMEAVKLSDGVTQMMYGGSFTCPTSKSELGFPEKASSLNETATAVNSLGSKSTLALLLALGALALSAYAIVRRT